jgi:predicted RNA binding protein YcfA (HicA-like mRNA interferase family)
LLKDKGWKEVVVSGSHYQFKDQKIAGHVTIPRPKRDLPWATVKSILKQAGLSEKDL